MLALDGPAGALAHQRTRTVGASVFAASVGTRHPFRRVNANLTCRHHLRKVVRLVLTGNTTASSRPTLWRPVMFQSIVDLIKGLAWPIVVVWLCYFFRSEIIKLLGRINRFKHGDTEVDFGTELAKAEVEANKAQSRNPVQDESADTRTKEDQLLRIATMSPRAAINEAWVMVEDTLAASGFSSGTPIPRFSPRSLVGVAAARSGLTPDLSELIQSLRKLRNRVAHEGNLNPTQEEAEAYIRSAIKSIAVIKERLKFT